MKIYTKGGDDGTTGLFGGGRVPKTSLRIEAYGTVDELNSVIGFVRTMSPVPRTNAILGAIQLTLFTLGADLATALRADKPADIKRVTDDDIKMMESWIDEIDGQLQPLRVFILPGGSITAAQLHVARTVCRRTERCTVALAEVEDVGTAPVIFLNRLSDLLFVLARFENAQRNIAEDEWHSS